MNADKGREGVNNPGNFAGVICTQSLSRKIPFNHTSVEIKWISENMPNIHKLLKILRPLAMKPRYYLEAALFITTCLIVMSRVVSVTELHCKSGLSRKSSDIPSRF